MNRVYRIADVVIETVFDQNWKMPSSGVLEEYVCDSKTSDVRIECELVNELPFIETERIYFDERKHVRINQDGFVRYYGHMQDIKSCYACTIRNGNQTKAFVKSSVLVDGIPSHLMAELLELEHLLAMHHKILLHASVICVDNEAILFTAPSKTGKSTQASLWQRVMDAQIINGDRCAVGVEGQKAFVYGVPFAGSSNIRRNVKLPIKAIVYLRQGPQNQAQKCAGASAFRRVYEGCSLQIWDEHDVSCVLDSVAQIIQNVPVIDFECRPDEQAVFVLKKKLEESDHEKSD